MTCSLFSTKFALPVSEILPAVCEMFALRTWQISFHIDYLDTLPLLCYTKLGKAVEV